MPDSLLLESPRITRAVHFHRPRPQVAGLPMDKLKIRGGKPLAWEVEISGAKNAALPILVASLLTPDEFIVDNVPQLQDVATTLKLLRQMGVATERDGATVRLKADAVSRTEAPYEMVKTMRASILVLGPLVARTQASLELFKERGAEAVAGLKPMLLNSMARMPDARLLDGRFMAVNHGLSLPRGRPAADEYLKQFVQDLNASGFIARSIERHGIQGLSPVQ